MNEMIKQLDDKELTFKELEERSQTYNSWQQTLETPCTVFDNLEELREDLLNRCLMWRSLRDWQAYTADKLESSFVGIKADMVKEEAAKYAKIVSRLEKSVPDNPILRKLKELVDTFRGAMPIVTALRRAELKPSHWAEINELIGAGLDVEQDGFTL